MKQAPVITAVPEPTAEDLDGIIEALKHSWTSTLTIRRQCSDDCGYREIFVAIDGQSIGYLSHGDSMTREIAPGTHRLTVHNTLFRKQADGLGPEDAAAVGTGEVAAAVISSTLTTCAVFLPIVFVRGLAARLITGLSFTVVVSLLVSLLAADRAHPLVYDERGVHPPTPELWG